MILSGKDANMKIRKTLKTLPNMILMVVLISALIMGFMENVLAEVQISADDTIEVYRGAMKLQNANEYIADTDQTSTTGVTTKSVTFTLQNDCMGLSKRIYIYLNGEKIVDWNQSTDNGKTYVLTVKKGTVTYGGRSAMEEDEDGRTQFDSYFYFVEPAHTHSWTYTVNGNVITGKCTSDCPETSYRTGYTVTLNASDAIYDKTSKSASISTSATTFPTGDGIAAKPTTITYYPAGSSTALSGAPVNAGNYVAKTTWGGATASKAFTISKKTISVEGISAESKTYDGTTAATWDGTAGSLPGVCAGDTVAFESIESAAFADKNAGNGKTVAITGTLSGAQAANYELKYTSTADINPLQAVLAWTPEDPFTYDSNEHIPSASVSNLVSGDTVNVTVTGGQTNAGTYDAEATGFTGTDKDNYALPDDPTYTYIINKAELTAADFTYAPPTGSLEYDGTGKEAIVTFTPDPDTKTGVGDITIIYVDAAGNESTDPPKSASTYTVKIDVAEGSNYLAASDLTGPDDKKWEFTIGPKELADDMFPEIAPQDFTGKPIEPDAGAKDGTMPLVRDRDFVAVYEDNMQ